MATINDKGNKKEATCAQERLAILDTFDVLGGKWRLRILRYLDGRTDENNTFKKIQREIENISAKMLTKELQDLELNGLVIRTPQDTRPITVSYAITEYGKTVLPLTESIAQWGLDHRTKIKEETKS